MKRIIVLALLFATSASISLGCVGWPEANADVKELRSLFQEYTKHVEPREPTRTASVEALAAKIDSCFEKMDALTVK